MCPSIYSGCVVSDTFDVALSEFRKSLEEARASALAQIEAAKPLLEALTSGEAYASLLIGESGINQVRWTAKTSGQEGNLIRIYYDYLGPVYTGSSFIARPPSSYVDPDNPTHIHCILAVTSTADIDPNYPIADCLPIWLSDSGVDALVTAEVVGSGLGIPDPVTGVTLDGGKGSPLTNSEKEANGIARVFGKTNYRNLLETYSIPVIETAADAQKYLNDLNSDYVIVNGKLLLVEGTNLVGIRALYEALGSDVTKLKNHLSTYAEGPALVYLVTTRDVAITTYQLVCGISEPFTEIKEEYLASDKNLDLLASTTSTDIQSINLYVFWSGYINPSTQNFERLQAFGIPTEYNGLIFTGEESTTTSTSLVQTPTVEIIEDPSLLVKLQLSTSEIIELLENKEVAGVKVPNETTVDEFVAATDDLLQADRSLRGNGLSSKTKVATAAGQGLNLGKTLDDSNRIQELTSRGRACARQSKFSPNIPQVDLPNIDFPNLPDVAKKVESMYGAIGSALNSSIKVFENLWDAAGSLLNPYLNKIQNLNSLADNLFNNNLGDCALGVGQENSGFLNTGGGGVSPTGGSLSGGITPSIGGIPIPVEDFQKFMTELSGQLNETLTTSLSEIMKSISYPLCMANQLLTSMTGTSSESSESNPCKEPGDLDDQCPPPDVQDIASASESISESLNTLPQMANEVTSTVATETFSQVEQFSGRLVSGSATVQQEVTRGIKTVVEELQKSFETKLKLLDKFDEAIQGMTTDTKETALTGGDSQQAQKGCTPPSVGFFSDAITELL